MKKSFIYIFAVIAISLVLFNCSKNPTDPAGFGNKNTCYIVTFSQNGSSIQSANIDTKIKDIFVKHNIDLTSLKYTYKNVLNGFAAYLTGEQVASLKSDKSIKRIEADQIFSLVDGIDAGKPGKNPPPPPGDNWGVDYVGGPLQIGSGVAWIIDTGIDLDHPDLNVNTNFSKSFVNGRPTADDDNGHGSHCAGIIACKNTNYNIGI
jgi:subtilisin family serine protease